MICPKCGQMLKTKQSVLEDNVRYRKRVCSGCKFAIYTKETECNIYKAQLVLNNYETERIARYKKRKKEADKHGAVNDK